MSIAICMATFNGEKYIDEQLLSIFRQSYKDWVLYIHDDNSTDDTLGIIKSYESRYPDKIKLFDDNVKTGGASQNFSYLLEKVGKSHPYVMFCDQDDVWMDNKIELTLETMYNYERLNPNVPLLVHTDLIVVNEKLNVIAKSMFQYQYLDPSISNDIHTLILQNVVTGCTMMINNKLIEKVKKIPSQAVMHDWWIALMCLKNGGNIILLNQPTILYRQHEKNTIGSKKINLHYYLQKLANIRKLNQNYDKVYNQLLCAGIKMNKITFIIRKVLIIFKKHLHDFQS